MFCSGGSNLSSFVNRARAQATGLSVRPPSARLYQVHIKSISLPVAEGILRKVRSWNKGESREAESHVLDS